LVPQDDQASLERKDQRENAQLASLCQVFQVPRENQEKQDWMGYQAYLADLGRLDLKDQEGSQDSLELRETLDFLEWMGNQDDKVLLDHWVQREMQALDVKERKETEDLMADLETQASKETRDNQEPLWLNHSKVTKAVLDYRENADIQDWMELKEIKVLLEFLVDKEQMDFQG
jgi:hypothetical protein